MIDDEYDWDQLNFVIELVYILALNLCLTCKHIVEKY